MLTCFSNDYDPRIFKVPSSFRIPNFSKLAIWFEDNLTPSCVVTLQLGNVNPDSAHALAALRTCVVNFCCVFYNNTKKRNITMWFSKKQKVY